jgi:hypothetical protein
MKILVKHIDKLVSVTQPNKVVDQYAVYVMSDNQPIYGDIAYGSSNKDVLVSKLFLRYFPELAESEKESVITSVSFLELINTNDHE